MKIPFAVFLLTVSLFVPCFVDQFYPNAALSMAGVLDAALVMATDLNREVLRDALHPHRSRFRSAQS